MNNAQAETLKNLAAISAMAAAAMSEVARAQPSLLVQRELQEADQRLATDLVSDAANFSCQIANSYMLCAGDYMCGLQYVVDPNHNLWFSSASLARSCCELANRSWWIADPSASLEQRISRGIAVLEGTISEDIGTQETITPAAVADLQNNLAGWKQEVGLREKAKLPGPTGLFEIADPATGKGDYKRLSNAAHGSYLAVLVGHGSAVSDVQQGVDEAGWRVHTASKYGSRAAKHLCDVKGIEPPESLAKLLEYLGLPGV